MIEVKNLTRRFGTHTAVDRVSFTAEPGKIYGFLGPNGAGKSTVMNMMTGYLAATEGTVWIDGLDIRKEPEKAKKKIGYLPENAPVYSDMTVREYLRFAAELKKIPAGERSGEITRVLDAAGLLAVSDRLCRNLSKGYRQRTGLAQALLGNPEILILDEPTSGLDPEQQKELFSCLNALRKDHIIILSSHILSDIRAAADVVWIMKEGRLIASDTPQNLQSRMSASQEFLLRAKGNRKELEQALRAIPTVKDVSVQEEGEALVFRISSDSGEDLGPTISRAAVYAGGAVLEMKREEKSLEDVFLSLTNETEDAGIRTERSAGPGKQGFLNTSGKADAGSGKQGFLNTSGKADADSGKQGPLHVLGKENAGSAEQENPPQQESNPTKAAEEHPDSGKEENA